MITALGMPMSLPLANLASALVVLVGLPPDIWSTSRRAQRSSPGWPRWALPETLTIAL